MSDLTAPFETQNVHDDDGQVIDSLFVETDAPPDLKPAADVVPSPAVDQPKKTTRLLTSSLLLQPSWGPQQILPADANRKALAVNVWSPTTVATDGVRVHSDLGDLNTGGIVLHNQTPTSAMLDAHTGPLYVTPAAVGAPGTPASAPVWVYVWAVTE